MSAYLAAPDQAWVRGFVAALVNVERISHDWQSIAYALHSAPITVADAEASGCMAADIEMVREAYRRHPRRKAKVRR